MALQIHRLLLASSILLPLLAISATARPGRPFHPCQTLILFSTTSSSSLPPFLENPNLPPQNPSNFRRQSITVFITQLRDPNAYYYPSFVVDRHEDKRPLPLPLYSSSLRDRTKDILSVVGSLLFGVGCGALTAATMFLMWSLFAPNRFDQLRDESDDEFDEGDSDDDDVSPKKMGYVAIPAAETDSPIVVAKEVA